MMRLSHYYHAYAAEGWEPIVTEHLDALITSGLATEIGALHLGIVGPLQERRRVAALCRAALPTIVVAEALEGWEQVTLTALHREVAGDAVLYAHGKGVADHSDWNDAWRRTMTLCMVSEWRENLALLETHDAVGCHWLSAPTISHPNPFFAGNFWMARTSVIRALPVPSATTRYDAEVWLGLGGLTNVADRTPGWPGYDSIRQE